MPRTRTSTVIRYDVLIGRRTVEVAMKREMAQLYVAVYNRKLPATMERARTRRRVLTID